MTQNTTITFESFDLITDKALMDGMIQKVYLRKKL